MPTRPIVHIDETLCDGCGLCIPECAEGALQIVEGKARLVSDVLCDGFGTCLGHCPQDAITIVEREADEFDEAAVTAHAAASDATPNDGSAHACPGTEHHSPVQSLASTPHVCPGAAHRSMDGPPAMSGHRPNPSSVQLNSQLSSWPVQLHLLNPNAPFLAGADLLLCADCVPFALPDFHRRYLSGRKVAIGCPKLDDVSPYVAKLAAIFRNGIRSLTVVKMEVPCCGGLVQLAGAAMAEAGVRVPVTVETVTVRGEVHAG